jgi:peptidyl-dipeptidase Dcp
MKNLLNISLMIALTALFSCGDEPANTPGLDANNPFFTAYNTPHDIPPFEKIKNEHFLPAINEGMKRQNEAIDNIIKNAEEANFTNTIVAYAFSNEFLLEVQSVMDNFLSSNTNDSLQKIATDLAPIMSKHSDNILMNAALFEKIEKVYNKRDQLNLNSEENMKSKKKN